MSDTTASPEAWAIAQKWIHDCRSTHEACKRPQIDWFPTRLLDLEKFDRPRVVETQFKAPSAGSHYITLSHRWSPQPSLLLSKHTKDELISEQGFDAARLPAAIQDATSVCRRMGVRYLWVDTLCILQDEDDLADWERESTLMGKVYENSLLNLSALAAADTEHSIFAARDPLTVGHVQVHTKLKWDVLELGDTVNECRLVDTDFWKTSVLSTHLNRRSWVMQERLLPVRVLYFGHHQLLWECASLKAAETYPKGLPGETEINARSRYKEPNNLEFRKLIGEGGLQTILQDENNVGIGDDPETVIIYSLIYDAWHDDIVSVYSRCTSTKGSDKLIAISGLAKKMASIVHDQYVVGMWRRRLPSELMWQCDNDRMSETEYPGPRRPKASYRAPSFSWASVDAFIKPRGYQPGAISCIRIMDVKLDFVVSNDPTGQCKGGHMVLQCRLQRAVLTRRKNETRWTLHITGSDGSLVDIELLHLDELHCYFEPVGRYDLYGVAWEYDSHPGVSHLNCYYLLFQAVDPIAGVFQRVGTAETCYRDEDCMKQGLSAGPGAANYPCLKYQDGWHTIKVI